DDPTSSTATKTGTTVGTPQYMSPEQVASSKVDGRSDLYSAGIMLYELVCGRPPFTAGPADGPFTLMAKHVQAPPPPPTLHRPGHAAHGVRRRPALRHSRARASFPGRGRSSGAAPAGQLGRGRHRRAGRAEPARGDRLHRDRLDPGSSGFAVTAGSRQPEPDRE